MSLATEHASADDAPKVTPAAGPDRRLAVLGPDEVALLRFLVGQTRRLSLPEIEARVVAELGMDRGRLDEALARLERRRPALVERTRVNAGPPSTGILVRARMGTDRIHATDVARELLPLDALPMIPLPPPITPEDEMSKRIDQILTYLLKHGPSTSREIGTGIGYDHVSAMLNKCAKLPGPLVHVVGYRPGSDGETRGLWDHTPAGRERALSVDSDTPSKVAPKVTRWKPPVPGLLQIEQILGYLLEHPSSRVPAIEAALGISKIGGTLNKYAYGLRGNDGLLQRELSSEGMIWRCTSEGRKRFEEGVAEAQRRATPKSKRVAPEAARKAVDASVPPVEVEAPAEPPAALLVEPGERVVARPEEASPKHEEGRRRTFNVRFSAPIDEVFVAEVETPDDVKADEVEGPTEEVEAAAPIERTPGTTPADPPAPGEPQVSALNAWFRRIVEQRKKDHGPENVEVDFPTLVRMVGLDRARYIRERAGFAICHTLDRSIARNEQSWEREDRARQHLVRFLGLDQTVEMCTPIDELAAQLQPEDPMHHVRALRERVRDRVQAIERLGNKLDELLKLASTVEDLKSQVDGVPL